MTRDEHLVWCKKCTNRQFNPQLGLVCKLTGRIADFEENCKDFDRDESVKEEVEVEDKTHEEIVASLPDELIAKLRPHQDLQYAIVGGLALSLVAALVWALITVTTKYQIGYMAIGVGFLVGMGVRYFGAGVDPLFGYIGGFFSLLGCLLGNLFSQVGLIAEEQYLGYFETLLLLDLETILLIYQETFNFIDILFYMIAIAAGYKFALRPIPSDIKYRTDFTPAHARLRLPLVIVAVSVIIVCLYTFSKGISGTQTFYYESGKRMSTGEYKDGKEHGRWQYFYENGTTSLEGEFNNGVEEGVWQWYADNGKIRRKGSYKSGLFHGSWVNYYDNDVMSDSSLYVEGRLHGWSVTRYENGQISQKGQYVRDRQDGNWEFYFPNGQKSMEGAFAAGINTGRWKSWSMDGKPLQELEYLSEDDIRIINAWDLGGNQLVKEGEGDYKNFYYDGTLQEAGQVKGGKRTGIWSSYHSNGKIHEKGEYKDNVYRLIHCWSPEGEALVVNGEGEYESYLAESGQLFEKGLIKGGFREGLWETYTEGEVLVQMMNYAGGKLQGKGTTYYVSGNTFAEGNFENGKREGEWKWYFESSPLQSVVSFKQDKKQGIQTFFSETGKAVKEEVYEEGEIVSESLLDI